MIKRILICTDLDRTLLPNGRQAESPGARAAFKRLVARPEVTLAYVSGRHRELVEDAIRAYELPSLKILEAEQSEAKIFSPR